MTTWHADESAAEVAAFFFGAGEQARTLLVAVIDARDAELATQLVEQTRLPGRWIGRHATWSP
jgi:hypothetical protein